MWLRWVVSNLLNEMAQEQMQHVMARAKNLVKTVRPPQPGSESPPQARPVSPPEVVLLFALGLESGGLVDRMTDVVTTECPAFVEHVGLLDGRPVLIAESGVGRSAAMQATEDIIKLHHPQWIVSTGFAGALVPELSGGHLLMANSLIDRHRHPLEVGFQMAPETIEARSSLHVGRLLTVDELVRQRNEKARLAAEFAAVAYDMETMAVAQVCQRRQVRFLSVRIISDGLDDRLSPEVEHMLDQPSLAGKLGAATRALFERPGSLKDMWKLREVAHRASDRLAEFLVGVVPQLQK
ncbi:MAG: phosphorylase family protein [Pirellulaceae bacterium]